jgi:hypothetical protein
MRTFSQQTKNASLVGATTVVCLALSCSGDVRIPVDRAVELTVASYRNPPPVPPPAPELAPKPEEKKGEDVKDDKGAEKKDDKGGDKKDEKKDNKREDKPKERNQ